MQKGVMGAGARLLQLLPLQHRGVVLAALITRSRPLQITAGRVGLVPTPSLERESCVGLIPASLRGDDLAVAAVPVAGC